MMSYKMICVLVLLGTRLHCVTPSGTQKHTRPAEVLKEFQDHFQLLNNVGKGPIEGTYTSLLDLTGVYIGTWTRLEHPAHTSSTDKSGHAAAARGSLHTQQGVATPIPSSSSSGGASVLMTGQSGRVMFQLTSGPSPESSEDDMAGVEGVLQLSEGMLIFGPGLKRLQLSGITTLNAEGAQSMHAVLKPNTPVLLPQHKGGSSTKISSSSSSSSSSGGGGGGSDVQQAWTGAHDRPLEKLWQAVVYKLGLLSSQQQQQQQQLQQQQQGMLAQLPPTTASRRPLAKVRWHRMSDTSSDLATAAVTAAAAEDLAGAAAAAPAAGESTAAATAAAAAVATRLRSAHSEGKVSSRLQNIGLSKDAACRFRLQLTVTPSGGTGSTHQATGTGHSSTSHSEALHRQAVQAVHLATLAAQRRRQQQQRAMLEGLIVEEAQPGFVVVTWQEQQQGAEMEQMVALQRQAQAAVAAATAAAGAAEDAVGSSSSSMASALSAVLLDSDVSACTEAEVAAADLATAARATSSSSGGRGSGGVSDPEPQKPARALLSRGFPGHNTASGTDATAGRAAAAAAAAAAVSAATRSALISSRERSSTSKARAFPAFVTPQQQQLQQHHEAHTTSSSSSSSSTSAQLSFLDNWLLPCSHPLQHNQLRCQRQQQQQLQQRLVIQGLLLSDNCNASWSLTAVQLPSGGVQRQAMCYTIVALLVCLLQVVVVRQQAQAVASSPAAAGKISLLGVCAGSQLDAFLSMAHLTAALAAPDVSLPLLVVAAAQFALFAGADMALTVYVWRAHQQQQQRQHGQQRQQLLLGSNFGQTSQTSTSAFEAAAAAALQQWHMQGWSLRRLAAGSSSSSNAHSSDDGSSSSSRVYALCSGLVDWLAAGVVQLVSGHSLLLLYVRFYLVLLAATAMSFVLTSQMPLILIAAYSFWIPQIIHSTLATAKQPITPAYVVSCTAGRILLPMYIFSCPDNILQLPTQPWLGQGIITWVGLQVALLLLQHYTHPHVFVPGVLRPLKYNYHRVELPWQFRQFAVKKKNSCSIETLDGVSALTSDQMVGMQDRQCCSGVGCVVVSSSRVQLRQQQQQQQGCRNSSYVGAQQRQQQHGISSSSSAGVGSGGGCYGCCGRQSTQGGSHQHVNSQQQQQQQQQQWPALLPPQQQQQHANSSRVGLPTIAAPLHNNYFHHYQQQPQPQLYSGLHPQQQPQQLHLAAATAAGTSSAASSTHCSSSSSQPCNSKHPSSCNDWRRCDRTLDDTLHDVIEGYDASTGEGVVECVICMAAVPLTPLHGRVVTPCGHFFHPGCLAQWMEVKAECPTCRWGPLPPL